MLLNNPHFHDKVFHGIIEYMHNEKGFIELTICEDCKKVTAVVCVHKFNTWKGEEGSRKLTCDLCGSDGT